MISGVSIFTYGHSWRFHCLVWLSDYWSNFFEGFGISNWTLFGGMHLHTGHVWALRRFAIHKPVVFFGCWRTCIFGETSFLIS